MALESNLVINQFVLLLRSLGGVGDGRAKMAVKETLGSCRKQRKRRGGDNLEVRSWDSTCN